MTALGVDVSSALEAWSEIERSRSFSSIFDGRNAKHIMYRFGIISDIYAVLSGTQYIWIHEWLDKVFLLHGPA